MFMFLYSRSLWDLLEWNDMVFRICFVVIHKGEKEKKEKKASQRRNRRNKTGYMLVIVDIG